MRLGIADSMTMEKCKHLVETANSRYNTEVARANTIKSIKVMKINWQYPPLLVRTSNSQSTHSPLGKKTRYGEKICRI